MFKTSRRWNAARHIKTVHKGNALAFNSKSGELSDLSTPSLEPGQKYLIPFVIDSYNYQDVLGFTTIESDLKSSMSKEENTMLLIYEELCKQINTLEELVLLKAITEFQIPGFLIYALSTENPIYTLGEIIQIIRYRHAKNKVILYASKVTRADYAATAAIILSLVKNTPYYKTKNRFQSKVNNIR